MDTVRLFAKDSVILEKNNLTYRDSESDSVILSPASNSEAKALWVHFEDVPSAYKYKLLSNEKNNYSCAVYVYECTYTSSFYVTLGCVLRSFNVSTATIDELWTSTTPNSYPIWSITRGPNKLPAYTEDDYAYSNNFSLNNVRSLINVGGVIFNYFTGGITNDVKVSTSSALFRPYIDVAFQDVDYHLTASRLFPDGGFIDDAKISVFMAETSNNGYCIADDEFAANTKMSFQWRLNSSDPVREIAATSTTITVPANTFPSEGSFQARLKVTDALGYTTYTDWYTYTTIDETPTATPVSPKNTVETDSAPVTFTWQHLIPTGTEQSSAELQWSANLISWNTLTTEPGSANTKSVDLSGLPGGTIYWRVRTANSDGVFSEWSEPVSFIYIAAPPEPVVSVNPIPMAVISWQALNQQAYEVMLDGISQGIKFGNASSFTVREPLSDGAHTVSVKVQGAFSLWSPETVVNFTVRNIPGLSVTLTAENGIDALLTWTSAATDAVFYVYRDSNLIGKTRETQFSDRLTAGIHKYSVLAVLSSGYYSRSNTAEAASGSDTLMIADIDGGIWLDISHTPDSNGTQEFSWDLTSSARHFSGAKLPVIELSEFENETASYRTSMFSTDDAKEFEKLKGKICIVKSRRLEVVVAAMVRLQKTVGNFFVTYDFELQRINWEEILDETGS